MLVTNMFLNVTFDGNKSFWAGLLQSVVQVVQCTERSEEAK